MDRRKFLKRTAIAAGAAAMVGTGAYFVGSRFRTSRSTGKKVLVIGIDGMDPQLCEAMMAEGALPNLKKLRDSGAYSPLGTSIPPQSPVAWANFINGAGPGSHGIFDFMHRHPENQCIPFFSAAETMPGQGGWETGDHKLTLDFWPFNHKGAETLLRRQGTPFWNFLDEKGIPSTFYDLPSNFPASPSTHGHHRCICGMGTPDMLGSYGTYQHFATSNEVNETHPNEPVTSKGGNGKLYKLTFENDTAKAHLAGPENSFLRTPHPVNAEFLIHRDEAANAAVIDIQGQRIMLKEGQWSRWVKVNFECSLPWFLPNEKPGGIVRFYLQGVRHNFKLYASPINVDPSSPAMPISEPNSFIKDVSKKVGLFYTTGFQEAYEARKDEMFNDDQYRQQATTVLEDRFKLFQYAIDDYTDGMFYFYFSSCDLQSHIFWWSGDSLHPSLEDDRELIQKRFGYVKDLYKRIDKEVVGEIMHRYGDNATIIVMSDHGFANFGRQFNLNTWLRANGYLGPEDCTALVDNPNVDWKQTKAYGLGINGLYLNMKGRERDGIVEPSQKDALLSELVQKLEAVQDPENPDKKPIRTVYRADRCYHGTATDLAPDLIVGYSRNYRASWETCTGGILDDVFSDNKNAWAADHCADALEVPGIFFCNKPMRDGDTKPWLVDMAPSILAQYDLTTPTSMTGKNVLK